jgi:hypothetical protein
VLTITRGTSHLMGNGFDPETMEGYTHTLSMLWRLVKAKHILWLLVLRTVYLRETCDR